MWHVQVYIQMWNFQDKHYTYVSTYVLISHNMIIPYFHLPYFHVSNTALFIAKYLLDTVLT